ncbi:hypothetical protein J6590_024634 [Homalodisca vitripennis]|nr:hypothetical protein J6590_024634 [Homalodisca vitripennis]
MVCLLSKKSFRYDLLYDLNVIVTWSGLPFYCYCCRCSQGLSEAQSPDHGQDKHTAPTDQDKPALSTLASYSVGFANLGLKSARASNFTGECFEVGIREDVLNTGGAHLATRAPIQDPAPPTSPLIGEIEKPALSALACHAIGFADLGLKK